MLSNFAGNGNGANVSQVNRKSRQGLSLIELLIIFGMIMILGSICAINLGGGCSGKSQSVDAVEQATAYANFMYPGKNARVQCVRLDSDRDGYVSCTIAYDAENAVTGLTLTEPSPWNVRRGSPSTRDAVSPRPASTHSRPV